MSLWLPQTDGEALGRAAARPACGGRRCVLLVDDAILLREVMSEFLGELRFRVRDAAGGGEALAVLDAGEAVDVLVTDLSMPGMDGLELIRAARDRPGLGCRRSC